MHTPEAEWPPGIRLQNNRMVWEGLICVPETCVAKIVRDQHTTIGHAGVKKTVSELQRRFTFPSSVRLWEAVREDRRRCVVCQACDPPNWSGDTPIENTPIPAHIMSHVSVDLFTLPQIQWQGQQYDTLVVCVDRLSGWIIARPALKNGLTSEKVAHLLLENGWDTFGIPSVITSDQGPHFSGHWWKTMCSRLGIRVAYSQAYRAQANGRAEVAGKSLINALRKLWAEQKLNWVEALPRVLRVYHNTPGESGLSPFQIIFGRDRYEAGAPYEIPHECEGATQFFSRVQETDTSIASTLKEIHQAKQSQINANRNKRPSYTPGALVWILRPRSSPQTVKLDTWWMGPAKVLERLGDQSYRVQIKANMTLEVHASHMKPYLEDLFADPPVELYHFQSTHTPQEVQVGDWTVDTILRHRKNKRGEYEFLTRWEHAEPNSETWEPASNFILHYNYELVQYCQKKGIQLDLAKILKPIPSD